MAFHRRRRHFRARMPELAGLLLLAASLAAGFQWYVHRGRDVSLTRTSGRIVQVSGSAAAAPRILYTYVVGGVTYSNVTAPDLTGRTLASLLPIEILAKLNARGIFDFADLPEDVRQQIHSGTSHTFEELSDKDRQALQARGYRNAEQLRLAALAAMNGIPGWNSETADASALNLGISIPVLYDPDDPAYSVIAGTDGRAITPASGGLTPFLALASLTCAYFATVYPWVKRGSA